MTVELGPGLLLAGATVRLDHSPLPASQVVTGAPTTATLVLDDRDGREIGIWEMTPGTATDTEVDEVFVVLSGRATVTGASPEPNSREPLSLEPGSIVRLTAGMQTTWTVHETLRKLYIA